jgi:hypothetical protein
MEDIRLYTGIGEVTYNHHPVYAGEYACVSPVTGRGGIDKRGKQRKQRENSVVVPPETKFVLLDSGAYSDTTFQRCAFDEALERQLRHAEKYNYLSRILEIVSYDVLVDEQIGLDGERVKQRMNPDLAKFAVEQTIKAAAYLSSKRDYIYERVGHPVGLVFSAQGSDTEQYLKCAEAILPFVQPGDVFGLGGWCILGRQRTLLPTFYATIDALVPMLQAHKVKRAHIFGVCDADALGSLLWQCDHYRGVWSEKHRIQLSTDSVGPTTRIVKEDRKGSGLATWGYASWANRKYPVPHVLDSCKVVDEQGKKAPTCPPGTPCRGLERARHVVATREWLAHFRERENRFYRYEAPRKKSEVQQLSLLDVEATA